MKKQILTIVYIFCTFVVYSQITGYKTSYDSYFQTIVNNQEVRILHMPMCITVTDVDVIITVTLTDKTQSLLTEHLVNWKVGVNCFNSLINEVQITYWPKENKLVINDLNNRVESTYYGSIPQMLSIRK